MHTFASRTIERRHLHLSATGNKQVQVHMSDALSTSDIQTSCRLGPDNYCSAVDDHYLEMRLRNEVITSLSSGQLSFQASGGSSAVEG